MPPTTTDTPVDTLLARATLFGTAAGLHLATARATEIALKTNKARTMRAVNHIMMLMTHELNQLPDLGHPPPQAGGRIMSSRRQKQKRLTERRRYVHQFMATYIAELRQILKRVWPAYERSHPDTRGPCHTCAFNPSTDTWTGFEKTVFKLMDAIRKGQPFHCHEGLMRKANGEWYYNPTALPLTRCRG